MRKGKLLGYYVIDAAGQQVAWHKTRAQARKIALDYSRRLGGIFYTQPEYEEAA
jgi:hypothetical protein